MPGPHSHTNPPSVFTQWPSQEELKHSSMSAKRKSSLAQPTLNMVGVQGESRPHADPVPTGVPRRKARYRESHRRGGGGTRPLLVDPPDQRPERMAETALSPPAPPTQHILAEWRAWAGGLIKSP